MDVDDAPPPDDEEVNNLARSTKKVKTQGSDITKEREETRREVESADMKRKKTFKNLLLQFREDERMEEGNLEGEDEVSDDDEAGQEENGPWVQLGTTKEEKKAARQPWKYSVIIKVVGKKIGYHYLYNRIQAMWRLQSPFILIDLANDFFIVKLSTKQEQNTALFHGPWMVADHYLHMRKWRPNFEPETAEITTLPVWVRFSVLPVECYNA